jgi:hypothetical protein
MCVPPKGQSPHESKNDFAWEESPVSPLSKGGVRPTFSPPLIKEAEGILCGKLNIIVALTNTFLFPRGAW